MSNHDIALMAHLMRRAGFGAPREELEARAARDTRRQSRNSYTQRRSRPSIATK